MNSSQLPAGNKVVEIKKGTLSDAFLIFSDKADII